MGDLDPKSLFDSARSFGRLRHRRRLVSLGLVAPAFALLILLGTARNETNFLVGAAFLLFVPWACFCSIAGLLTSIDLWGFRCPRCGERFAVSRRNKNNWPSWRCKHCDLDLGPSATATKKHIPAADPLE